MPDDAYIHLRVPAATKSRWVRASRAAGMRLTDWIVQKVENQMQLELKVSIPEGTDFSDLKLERRSNGGLAFDWTPIERLCEASGIPLSAFKETQEDNVGGLIAAWYFEHLAHGGARDPVADDLIAEVKAEDATGQKASFPSGTA
jgi:hypothetical protein